MYARSIVIVALAFAGGLVFDHAYFVGPAPTPQNYTDLIVGLALVLFATISSVFLVET